MARIDFQKNDTYRKSFGGVLKIQKHVDSENDLPETGASEGDIYTVGESNTMMLYHNGEFKPMGSGGSVSWNDVTDKPFYTQTFPSIDLPDGIKVIIDGYIREGAQPDDTTGVYDVYDTRFDIQLVSRADNSVLKSLVGVIPEFLRNHSQGFIVAIEIDYDEMHMTDNLGQKGVLMLNLSRIEPSSFNDTVRSWGGHINFYDEVSTTSVADILLATPAKASAVKGQDYDTVTVESTLNGYTSHFKRDDYVKKIDNKYLPSPNSSVWIKGNPVSSTTTSELETMGLTADVIESVASGEIMNVLIGPGGKSGPPDLFNVIERVIDDVNGSSFICENVKFDAYGIEYTKYKFHVIVDISETEEEIRYPQIGEMRHYRYEIQAEAEAGGGG